MQFDYVCLTKLVRDHMICSRDVARSENLGGSCNVGAKNMGVASSKGRPKSGEGARPLAARLPTSLDTYYYVLV